MVDQDKKLLNIAELLNAWQPDGAIWYAHACCSAGTDANTSYAGLFDAGSDLDRILRGVTTAGSRVAPLPTALLGATKPARAFVGHVEPTFDWPLQDPETGQPLSLPVSDALTRNSTTRIAIRSARHSRAFNRGQRRSFQLGGTQRMKRSARLMPPSANGSVRWPCGHSLAGSTGKASSSSEIPPSPCRWFSVGAPQVARSGFGRAVFCRDHKVHKLVYSTIVIATSNVAPKR